MTVSDTVKNLCGAFNLMDSPESQDALLAVIFTEIARAPHLTPDILLQTLYTLYRLYYVCEWEPARTYFHVLTGRLLDEQRPVITIPAQDFETVCPGIMHAVCSIAFSPQLIHVHRGGHMASLWFSACPNSSVRDGSSDAVSSCSYSDGSVQSDGAVYNISQSDTDESNETISNEGTRAATAPPDLVIQTFAAVSDQ